MHSKSLKSGDILDRSVEPLVSILMNCYNGEKYLKEAVDSVKAQTYQNWKLIFIDNCSTDSSKVIIEDYCNDKRFTYIKTPRHMALGEAREFGLAKCQGKYISFLDTDDIWMLEKLERQVGLMNSNPEALLNYTGYYTINGKGKITGKYAPSFKKGDLFGENLGFYEVNFQTVMLNCDLFKLIKKPLFDPALKYAPDYNLFMRILANGNSVSIPDILVLYRVSNDSLSTKTISLWGKEMEYTYKQLDNLGVIKDKASILQQELALATIDYKKALYLISIGRKRDARALLAKHKYMNYRYFSYYYFSYFPLLLKILRIFKAWLRRINMLKYNAPIG